MTDTTEHYLLRLSYEDFEELVMTEAHARAPEHVQRGLRHPAVLPRWSEVLSTIVGDLNTQMSQQNADLAALEARFGGDSNEHEFLTGRAEIERKRAQINRLKFRIESRLRECRVELRKLPPDPGSLAELHQRIGTLERENRELREENARLRDEANVEP